MSGPNQQCTRLLSARKPHMLCAKGAVKCRNVSDALGIGTMPAHCTFTKQKRHAHAKLVAKRWLKILNISLFTVGTSSADPIFKQRDYFNKWASHGANRAATNIGIGSQNRTRP